MRVDTAGGARYLGGMDAVVWSALAILTGGQIATLVYLGGRIDGVGDSLNGRIDGLGESLNGRIDGLGESLNGRIDRVLDLLMDHDRRITRLEG